MSENINVKKEETVNVNEVQTNRWKKGLKILVVTGLSMYVLGRIHGGRSGHARGYVKGYSYASMEFTDALKNFTKEVTKEVVED